MNLPFSVKGSTEESRKVMHSEFQSYYPSINGHTQFSAIQPYIEEAVESFVIPYIGLAAYDELYAETLTTQQEVALEYVKKATANYTIYLALPKINTLISDMGQVETSNQNTAPVPQWKSDQTRYECMRSGDSIVDRLLDYMEDASFTTYKASDEYTRNTNVWFKTATRLSEYLNVKGRRAYIKMLPSIRKAVRELEFILCEELDMVTGWLTLTTYTAIQSKMLDLVREYLASHALSIAIPHLTLVQGEDGFVMISRNDGINNRANVGAAFKKEATEQLLERAKQDAAKAEMAIKRLLYSDDTTFALWAAARDEETERKSILHNDECTGAIML